MFSIHIGLTFIRMLIKVILLSALFSSSMEHPMRESIVLTGNNSENYAKKNTNHYGSKVENTATLNSTQNTLNTSKKSYPLSKSYLHHERPTTSRGKAWTNPLSPTTTTIPVDKRVQIVSKLQESTTRKENLDHISELHKLKFDLNDEKFGKTRIPFENMERSPYIWRGLGGAQSTL